MSATISSMPEELPNGDSYENLERPPAFFPYSGDEPEREIGNFGELMEVRVDGVYAAESNGSISRFVLLSDGRRKLPILIGPFESQAIQLVIEGTRPDRPLTHDLIKNILDRVEIDVDRVVIDDFWNAVYYAKVFLLAGNEEIELDARPSDAIALAMRFDAPIFVADALMDHDVVI